MDKIGNLLTSLRNAGVVNKDKISIPYSKTIIAILDVLKREGYIKTFESKEKEYRIDIVLEYDNKNNHRIVEANRISKPGRRVYYKQSDIKKVKSGYGNVILSTPQGIMTGKEARSKNTGGEALFEIL
ncbi:MAG: 30S ribosomal protein S8 [Candidatus Pacebacteria bacterium]|nr:30S ribosomal protein S8 [Candidatus Paceibacterota bacterium]